MAPQPIGKSPVTPVAAPVPASPRGKASHRFPRHRRGARPPWAPATRPSRPDGQRGRSCLTGTSGQSAFTISHQTCARIAGADSYRARTKSANPRQEGPASPAVPGPRWRSRRRPRSSRPASGRRTRTARARTRWAAREGGRYHLPAHLPVPKGRCPVWHVGKGKS